MFDNRLQPSNEPLIPSSYTTTEQAQPLFTLTEEEVILLRYALSDAIYYCDEYSKEKDSAKYSEKYTKMFDKVSEWLYDNEI